MAEFSSKIKTPAPAAEEDSTVTKVARGAVRAIAGVNLDLAEGLTKRLGELNVPGTGRNLKSIVSDAVEQFGSLLKDAPGGLKAVLIADAKTAPQYISTSRKVMDASYELALGELTLKEKEDLKKERESSANQNGKVVNGPLEKRVQERFKAIHEEAYSAVDRSMSPADRMKCVEEETSLSRWDRKTVMSTAGGRMASMPETPTLLLREESVLNRLQNRSPHK